VGLTVYVEQLGSGEPEIAVVGAIHGDEPCGEYAVRTLLDEQPPVKRPVKCIVANEEALAAEQRYVETDLNRAFPGDPHAPTHEGRLAAALAEELRGCTVLGLHSTQSYDGMFALVDEVGPATRSICPRLSIDAVVETTGANEGRIFAVAPDTIEIECGYQQSPEAAENAVQVTREFLAATGTLPDAGGARQVDLPVFRLRGPIPKRAADTYDVFVSNFEEVTAGEVFAAMGGEDVVADEPFHPVLLSSHGYEDVFGYRAERVGTLSAADA
jgi:predicted deacylase